MLETALPIVTPALTLDLARTAIDATPATARRLGFKPMGVVVVDAAAQVPAPAREDGASALRLTIALGKAGAAIGASGDTGDEDTNYFIDPFGIVIEYTAEVEQIDDSHRAGQPADWTWPPGRVDRWGISAPPSPSLKDAQRAVLLGSDL
jgi:hypothetical protein